MPTADLSLNSTGGVAAATDALLKPVKQVVIRNRHATQVLYVRVASSAASSAAAQALATASPAVVDANENIVVPAGQSVIVFDSAKRRYVAWSQIASGAATTYNALGRESQTNT